MMEKCTRIRGRCCQTLLVALLVLAASVKAALPGNRYVIRQFSDSYGISSGINAVAQTQDGYLWLGTFGGLYRFDGSKATRFQVQRPSSSANAGSGPSSDRIIVLHEDSLGRLWIGTEDGGLTLYQQGKFKLLPLCGGTCHVKGIVESRGKDLWVATNAGLMRIDIRTLRAEYIADSEPGTYEYVVIGSDDSIYVSGYKGMGKVVGDRIQKIYPPHKPANTGWLIRSVAGKLWVKELGKWLKELDRSDDLYSFDPITAHWQKTDASGEPIASFDGNLWVSNAAGDMFRIADGNAPEKISGLPSMRATSVVDGGNGLYWVTSIDQGLWGVQVENNTLIESDVAGIPYAGRAIAEEGKNGIWLGFSCGGLRYLRSGETLEQLNGHPELRKECVRSLLRDREGSLWVGTTAWLLHLSKGKLQKIRLPDAINNVQIWQADDGGLWVGVEQHTYALKRDEEGNYVLSPPITVLEGMTIRKMRDARRGGIWFVGDQGAFRLMDGRLVEKWTLAEGLSSRFARTIHEDDSGTWIGTYGGGLNLVRQGKIHIYDESNGLQDNTVSCIEPDRHGRLWLGGNKGISVLPDPGAHASIESVPVKVSADSTSFEVNGGAQSSCLRDSKGHLWFSLVKGFLTLDPDDYQKVESAIPPVHIERVTSARGTLDAANQRITLDPRTASVQIEYVGINLMHPDLLAFRYRMSGQNSNWIHTKTGRSISYENIPWGEHVFEVQARNQGGKWSESARLLISRPAPWYQRQWLWPLVSLCSLILLVWRTRTTPQSDRHRERVDRILAENQVGRKRKTGASDSR